MGVTRSWIAGIMGGIVVCGGIFIVLRHNGGSPAGAVDVQQAASAETHTLDATQLGRTPDGWGDDDVSSGVMASNSATLSTNDMRTPVVSAVSGVATAALPRSAEGSSGGGDAAAPAAASTATTTPRLTLDDIPESPLRETLVVLKPEALDRALRKLSSIRGILKDAQSLRSDAHGGIYYMCTFKDAHSGHQHVHGAAASESGGGSAPPVHIEGDSVSIENPPVYHSRPGALNVLFLDFNGGEVRLTAWNNTESIAAWDCRPFDINDDTNTFSATEQELMRQIWERVAEDYAPFDVDITTEEPEEWEPTIGHAMITPHTDKNGDSLPHDGAGGVAYIDVFGEINYSYDYTYYPPGCYSPVWVDSEMSGNNYANVAEAISHEFGHNFGLTHDGTTGDEYYDGHGFGSISWAPIMGTAYGKHVSQWSRGEYYDYVNAPVTGGAQSDDDDLWFLSGDLGYYPDDHSNTTAEATTITVADGAIASTTGLVERSTDVDMFALSLSAGEVAIDVDPYICGAGTHGGNLDIAAVLYDDGGSVVVSNNPAGETYADISTTLASAGTYYLQVAGVGVGNPTEASPTGYTDYGSLGQYFISGTISDLPADPGAPIPTVFKFQ